MSKIYFVAMAGPNSAPDLKYLLEPLRPHIDGIVIVLHDSRGAPEDDYLTSIDAHVIHLPWSRRHAFARNHYLWCGPIQQGDWVIQCDVLERINPQFAANLRHFISGLEPQGVNAVFYYNKAFIYQQHESLEFVGSPHEGLRRHDGQMRAIELSQYYPTETDVRYSVRGQRRDTPFSWVTHYLRYYLYPYGSNHCLLGNCDRGDEMIIFRQRETMRNTFRDEMRRRQIPMSVDSLVQYWRDNPLDDKMIYWINHEKILNDAYRYLVRGDESVIDEHRWTSLKPIDAALNL